MGFDDKLRGHMLHITHLKTESRSEEQNFTLPINDLKLVKLAKKVEKKASNFLHFPIEFANLRIISPTLPIVKLAPKTI